MLAIAALICNAAQALDIYDPGFAEVVVGGGLGKELSSLTHIDANHYIAVTDSGDSKLYNIDIDVDHNSGAVTSASISGTPVQLSGAIDPESTRLLSSGQLLVGDEGGGNNTLSRYDRSSGALLSSIAVPEVYRHAAANGGFEGMAVNPSNGAIWAINENALPVDKPAPASGELLRLQSFDANGNALAQFAYRTEPAPGSFAHGVSELLALPSGELLSLERTVSGSAAGIIFHLAIFQIDTQAATDISNLATLDGAPVTSVLKKPLWSADLSTNYEGMDIGPQLANGNYSLLLIADPISDSESSKIKALQISSVPLPAGAWLFGSALCGMLRLRSRKII